MRLQRVAAGIGEMEGVPGAGPPSPGMAAPREPTGLASGGTACIREGPGSPDSRRAAA